MKKILLLIFATFMVLSTAEAKDTKNEKKKGGKNAPTEMNRPAPKKVSFTKLQEGLFGVQRKGKDWYLNINDSILGRPILAVTRYTTNTVGAGKYGGEEINEQTVYFEQGVDSTLLLRAQILNTAANENDAIFRAVKVSAEDPIIASFKLDGRIDSTKTSRIKVTELFEGDNQSFGFSSSTKRSMNLGAIQRGSSFINSIRTYPINTEVTTTKTYAYQTPDMSSMARSGRRPTILPAGYSTGVVTLQINTSFVLLPKVPMQRRSFDSRVGYFASSYEWFSDKQQSVDTKTFIARYRLEARPEDIEKQKRGELVEPIKPIIYYIDPATPKQWVPYLIQGVNDWNQAFEQAGWKNAIRGEEWPNDSTMSLEDARFSVIRYLASDIANAYGPHVSDPRSGEIIESHVGWYHNVMQLVHDWYMIQAGAIDPRARKAEFDDELMGQLIRFVSSHEVGHTLGLRHNMGSSHQTPVEKLRDKAFVEANGHTVSIMDYARFNYVAQPEDNIKPEGIYARIGDYDKWAIEYGYKPSYLIPGSNGKNITDDEEEHLLWNKEIMKRLAADPRLWFGGEGRNGDPRAQTEDLGDNSMLASDYGVKNLKRILPQLPEWSYKEADDYSKLKQHYESLVGQFQRYIRHVATNIGGLEETFKTIEQDGNVYAPTAKATQKEALAWLNKNVFEEPKWLTAEDFMYKFTSNPNNYLYQQASYVVASTPILSLSSLNRMQRFADSNPANYSASELLDDVYKMIFKELENGSKVSNYRRQLQRAYVNTALSNIKGHSDSDAAALILAQIMKIQKKAKASAASDAVTKAHWTIIAQTIDQALEAK